MKNEWRKAKNGGKEKVKERKSERREKVKGEQYDNIRESCVEISYR